jgi:hypothetical protein
MAEVLESHFRETFGQARETIVRDVATDPDAEIDQIMQILRTYLK